MKSLFYFFERINYITSLFLAKKVFIDALNLKETNNFKTFYIHMHNRDEKVSRIFLYILTFIPFFKKEILTHYLRKKLFLEKDLRKKNYFRFKKANSLFFKNNFLKNNNFLSLNSFFFNSFFFFLISNFLITKTEKNAFNFFYQETSDHKILYFLNLQFTSFFSKNKHKNTIYFLNSNKIKDFWFFVKNIYVNDSIKRISVINPLNDLINLSNSFADRPAKFENDEIKKVLSLKDYSYLEASFFPKKVNTEDLDSSKNFLIYLKNCSVYFSKKNYLYNKGKFSRNRQTYKTGVYLCIWLTVLTVIGLYFYFYLMSIKFTYFYILFLFFVSLFFYKYYTKKKNSEYEEHSSLFNNL